MGYVSSGGQTGGLSRVWETLADIDYTTQDDYNFQTEGVGVIGGLTHELYNASNATQFQILNGTGLVIQADNVARVLDGSTISVPLVSYRVPDVGLDCGCAWRADVEWSMTGFANADSAAFGIGVASPLGAGGVNMSFALRGVNSGGSNQTAWKATTKSASSVEADTTDADLFASAGAGIRVGAGEGGVVASTRSISTGVYRRIGSASWDGTQRLSVIGGTIEPFIGLLSFNTSTTGTLTVTRFVLERLRTS